MQLIKTIVIPNYPSSLMMSKSRRAVLYVSEESRVRGKKNIPKSFLESNKYEFDERGVLVEKETGIPKIANPRTAGLPRMWVVNFQDIWNQNVTKIDRNNKVKKLDEIISPYIEKIEPIREFPIEIGIIIYDIKLNTDVSNKGVIYIKIIEDLLTRLGKIPDDKTDFVNCSGRCKFVRIDNPEEIKMEIKIYKSDNNPF